MDSYAARLNATKQGYPFSEMREYWREKEEAEECDELERIFDELVARLVTLGEDAPKKQKIRLFEQAIEASNDHDGVIETGEREDLCALTNAITLACGLNPDDYGGGEGLASEWRNW